MCACVSVGTYVHLPSRNIIRYGMYGYVFYNIYEHMYEGTELSTFHNTN